MVATHGYGAQLVGCEERGPLRLGVGGLDLVTAGDQQLGVRVRGEGDVQGVLPARLVLGHVARRADLRVAEEQEVEVAVELAGLERVRRGPGAVATDAVGVRGVLLQVVEDRVAVEAAVDRVGGDDGRVGGRAARESAVLELPTSVRPAPPGRCWPRRTSSRRAATRWRRREG